MNMAISTERKAGHLIQPAMPSQIRFNLKEIEMYVNIHGYRYIKTPSWFTGSTFYNNQAKEHQIVMCLNMGITEIPKGYVVHHIDGDKLNNSPSNLQLLTKAKHLRIHIRERGYASGHKLSKETKARMSEAKTKDWSNPDYKQRVSAAMRGKREVVECPHCGKRGGGGNMRRYHFDKCKFYFGSAAMRR